MSKKQKNELINILFTSKGITTRVGDDLPYSKLAVHFLQLEGTYSEIKRKFREKYKGLSEEEALSDFFEKKKKKMVGLISDHRSELLLSIPSSSESDEEKKVGFELSGTTERKSVIERFYSQSQANPGDKVTLRIIPEEYFPKVEYEIKKLGKAALQYKILCEAEEVAVLNGNYKGFEDFETVPKACERYVNDICLNFDIHSKKHIKDLKNWIKESVFIIENEEIFYDWNTINDRINSWISHQRGKPNK